MDGETGLDEWTRPTGAHNAYKKGDKVVYKGSGPAAETLRSITARSFFAFSTEIIRYSLLSKC